MRVARLAAAVTCLALPAAAQTGEALRWSRADETGQAAWGAVLAAMPDLARDARRARFDATRRLRQITVDLDGDGTPELLLSGTLEAWCGSAGCATFVLAQREGAWAMVCSTYARYGTRGGADVTLRPAEASGWRGFDATYRVSFARAADGTVTCAESPPPQPGR